MIYSHSKLVCSVMILPLMLLGIASVASAESNFKIENFALNKSCPVYIKWKQPSFENDVYVITGNHADGSLEMTIDLSGSSPKGKVTGNYILRSDLTYDVIDNALQLKMAVFANAGKKCHISLTAKKLDGLKSTSETENLDLKTVNKNTVQTTQASSKLDKAKSTCTELGFKLGTEKHGECVMKMIDN